MNLGLEICISRKDSTSIWLLAYPEQNSTVRSTNREISGSIVQVNWTPGSRQGLERIQESTTDRDLGVLWSIILLHMPPDSIRISGIIWAISIASNKLAEKSQSCFHIAKHMAALRNTGI